MVKKYWFTVTVMGNHRLENALKIKFGGLVSFLIIFLIKVISLYTPLFLIRLIPSSICALFLSGAVRFKCKEKRFMTWITQISKSINYKKFCVHMTASFKLANTGADSSQMFLDDLVLNNTYSEEITTIAKTWVYFNFNHKRNFLFNKKLKNFYESTDIDLSTDTARYLPEHTRHMGHLGFLFLYANFYRKLDPNRAIEIFPDEAPNKFYLDELLKIFPLKVYQLSKSDLGKKPKFSSIDTLLLSRIEIGNWRFEPITAAGTGQNFPEYSIDSDFRLGPNLKFSDISIARLKSIGFDPNKWFVILHIKEDKQGYRISGETRDASIESYELGCNLIRDLGGQVVRMGGPNFPRISANFPAIDYAHSDINADYIDYWLWANCKFWIGNANGASVAVIPFGKPRLITNQWPWDPNSPITDFFLPKLVYDNKKARLLTPEETIASELSRIMNEDLFTNSGFTLIDNTPELIQASILEMFNSIELRNFSNNNSNLGVKSQNLELRIYSATRTPLTTPKMRLPNAFIKYYFGEGGN